ncbi:MAG: putative M18 family aminopeptidase 1 [Myxococcota bacterium]|nr:putative M18 family aminopeptidase 1 [Myxococcota bacterium]
MRKILVFTLILLVAAPGWSGGPQDSPPTFKRQTWSRIPEKDRATLDALAEEYIRDINRLRMETEWVEEYAQRLGASGFQKLENARTLKPGAKFFTTVRDRMLIAGVMGKRPVSAGLRVIAAHIDAVKLDLKPNPLYAAANTALLDSHYYGGIKKYQWLGIPLWLRGRITTRDGAAVNVRMGDSADDPVLVIPDLAAHVSARADDREGEQVPAEYLDAVAASRPADGESASASAILAPVEEWLRVKYGVTPRDLETASLALVPAHRATRSGVDKSMIAAYGQDDRACSFAALRALMDGSGAPEFTAVVVWADKEETGSPGITGMRSAAFLRALDRMWNASAGKSPAEGELRAALSLSQALSADVTLAAHPQYPETYDPKNMAYLGGGPVWDQSGANAAFLSSFRRLMETYRIPVQTGDPWSSMEPKNAYSTVLPYLTGLGMDGMDVSIPLLGMHGPYELISAADLYWAWRAYGAFLGVMTPAP